MENKAGNKGRVFNITVCIFVLALISVVIFQNWQINSMQEGSRLTAADKNAPGLINADSAAVEKSQNQNQKLFSKSDAESQNAGLNLHDEKRFKDRDPYGPDEKETQDNRVSAVLTSDGNAADKNNPGEVKPEEEEKDILETVTSMIQEYPAMEELVRTQLKPMLSKTYGDLAEELNLSPETENSLIELLIDKKLEAIDMAGQGGNVTPEDIKVEVEYLDNAYDEKISELLTPEEFLVFKEYEEVEPERMLLSEFNNINDGSDHMIDKSIVKKLIAAMYDERQKIPEFENPNQSTGNLKSDISVMFKLYDNYIASARSVLSESEMKNFSSFIDSKKSMLEMATKLTQQTFGNSKQQ